MLIVIRITGPQVTFVVTLIASYVSLSPGSQSALSVRSFTRSHTYTFLQILLSDVILIADNTFFPRTIFFFFAISSH